MICDGIGNYVDWAGELLARRSQFRSRNRTSRSILLTKNGHFLSLSVSAVALSGQPSEKCSVPRRVSTSSGEAMPGGIGVVILYCLGGWEDEVINSR